MFVELILTILYLQETLFSTCPLLAFEILDDPHFNLVIWCKHYFQRSKQC